MATQHSGVEPQENNPSLFKKMETDALLQRKQECLTRADQIREQITNDPQPSILVTKRVEPPYNRTAPWGSYQGIGKW